MNVLVTGAGGGVGQGIIKSLRMIRDMDIRIIAADMQERAAGLYAADVAYLVDGCGSPQYMDSLGVVFKKEAVDFYFPGTDLELEFCAKNKERIKHAFGVDVVVCPLETVQIADDKFKTAVFLKEHGFAYPKTEWLESIADFKAVQYPVIVKPAVGCRSMGVFKVPDEQALRRHARNPEGVIVQELIGSATSEYTCTVVKAGECFSPVLALRRELRAGDTYRAEPVQSRVIENYVRGVADVLGIEGACNFQLRLSEEGDPKIFEINSRFSGTTPFCAQLGFNPVEFYLKHMCGDVCEMKVDYGAVVLRYWAEAVVARSELEALEKKRCLNVKPRTQFHMFS